MEARIRSDLIQRAVLQTPGSTCFSCRGMYGMDAVWLSLLWPFICLYREKGGRQKRAQLEKCLALHWVLSILLWSFFCDNAVEYRPESHI